MDSEKPNPFDLTKATDLSDQQIGDLWVDIPGKTSLVKMVKPASRMPMFILGGKGSGKTHLMRYLSFPLQKIHYGNEISGRIIEEGYIGVYMRCDGLNADRFSGKGQTQEKWRAVFSYYMELWLGQLTLRIIEDLLGAVVVELESEKAICADIVTLLDSKFDFPPAKISEVASSLRDCQRIVDSAVNNSAITCELAVEILAAPGSLIFGIPKILVKHIPKLKDILFVYLIDEIENVSEEQQRYIQTLVREKALPCSFKIGARLHGVRTYRTFSADEENKEGSEYESLRLDDYFRKNRQYSIFARRLVKRRLSDAGLGQPKEGQAIGKEVLLDEYFTSISSSNFMEEETRWVVEKYGDVERPYFKGLRGKIIQGIKAGVASGLESSELINEVMSRLKLPQYPLLEKVNLLLFYQSWAKREDLMRASLEIKDECRQFVRDQKSSSKYKTLLGHFKGDLLAQLTRECEGKQKYLGLGTFIDMSQGLPRNLLIILKHIYNWSVFNGEHAFRVGKISAMSQQEGVRAASKWFLDDARSTGDDVVNARAAITRLAALFRDVRFSDKPSECSLVTFSCDEFSASQNSRTMIRLAEKFSLLIQVRHGQKDRNTRRVDSKYQLNPMLGPYWDLPISRRGAIALSVDEVNAIFDPDKVADFQSVSQLRISRMTAPHFGRTGSAKKQTQDVLPFDRP